MKVFISHQLRDAALAAQISDRLKLTHRIDSYLDITDPDANKHGEELAQHVRTQLAACTQLLAVVSPATVESWWVPWEIGIATERDYPLATYVGGMVTPPDYLKKWPFLRNLTDLDSYVDASRSFERAFNTQILRESTGVAQSRALSTFYRDLRHALRQ
jgi:hypothetical protein